MNTVTKFIVFIALISGLLTLTWYTKTADAFSDRHLLINGSGVHASLSDLNLHMDESGDEEGTPHLSTAVVSIPSSSPCMVFPTHPATHLLNRMSARPRTLKSLKLHAGDESESETEINSGSETELNTESETEIDEESVLQPDIEHTMKEEDWEMHQVRIIDESDDAYPKKYALIDSPNYRAAQEHGLSATAALLKREKILKNLEEFRQYQEDATFRSKVEKRLKQQKRERIAQRATLERRAPAPAAASASNPMPVAIQLPKLPPASRSTSGSGRTLRVAPKKSPTSNPYAKQYSYALNKC